jgi:hypothetical protein
VCTACGRATCRLIAKNRVAQGESYVAGGVALNELIGASRTSRDIHLFRDTREALAATWASDLRLLTAGGFEVDVLRERPTFVEAVVRRGSDSVVMIRTWPPPSMQDSSCSIPAPSAVPCPAS